MKALIVEDTDDISRLVEISLKLRWPTVEATTTKYGEAAIRMVRADQPDIVVLDLGLPDISGLDVLKQIRQEWHLPVIIVTSREDDGSIVDGLDSGADDYLVKPFSPTELVARVSAVLRRASPSVDDSETEVITLDNLVVDLGRNYAAVDNTEVELTPTEWRLLECFMKNRGRVVHQVEIAEQVWGSGNVEQSTVKSAVRRLRLKLGDDPQDPKLIRSARGIGYRFGL